MELLSIALGFASILAIVCAVRLVVGSVVRRQSRLKITTMRTGSGWDARLTERPGIWDAGKTEKEALGELVISLNARGLIVLDRER